MFVADVKCSQATWQTVPNSRTSSAKASVSEAVVRTWHRTHGCIGGGGICGYTLYTNLWCFLTAYTYLTLYKIIDSIVP